MCSVLVVPIASLERSWSSKTRRRICGNLGETRGVLKSMASAAYLGRHLAGRAFGWVACWSTLLALPIFGHSTPLEVYGRLPGLEDVSLSPDGSKIAFVTTTQNTRATFSGGGTRR